jgi:hypothetical protein
MLWYFTFNNLLSKFNNQLVFHNPAPPYKSTAPFGAKTTWADSTLKRLLPLYISIRIGPFIVLFKNMLDEK